MKYFVAILLCFIVGCQTKSEPKKKKIKPPWPKEALEITYTSDADQTQQPAMVSAPEANNKKRPLLVALHTWKGHYKQTSGILYVEWCMQNNWYMIHPHFRGPNNTPEALGSELVVEDIVSAVEYMKSKYPIDESRIYLSGGSGGGHAALLMAARKPEIWAGVTVWCPITDVQHWWAEKNVDTTKNSRYAKMIELAVGGQPLPGTEAFEEAKKRSPVTYLRSSQDVKIDLNHGVMDGRVGSVPFTHSLKAFNLMCKKEDRLSSENIELFYQNAQKPEDLKTDSLSDPLYGEYEPLFRRVSGNVRLTIFNAGHSHIKETGLNWLAKQQKNKPVVWDISDPIQLKTTSKKTSIER